MLALTVRVGALGALGAQPRIFKEQLARFRRPERSCSNGPVGIRERRRVVRSQLGRADGGAPRCCPPRRNYARSA